MKNPVLILGGLLLLGGVGVAIALGGKKKGPVDQPGGEPERDDPTDKPDEPDEPAPPQGKKAQLIELMKLAGLPEDWQGYFLITARGESGFNNLVGLGAEPADGGKAASYALWPPWAKPNKTASLKVQFAEAAAARKAYKRAIEQGRYAPCGNPWPAARYSFGSGGNFGGLPSNMLHAWTSTPLACADPWLVFEMEAGLVFAIAMARRIVQSKAFQKDPKFKWIRVAWASVNLIGDQEFLAKKINKWRGHAQDAGVPPSLLDQKPSHLPKFDYVKLYEHLKTRGGKIKPAVVETYGVETDSGLLLVGVNGMGTWGVFTQPVDVDAVEDWLRLKAAPPPQMLATGIGGKEAANEWIVATQPGAQV